VLRICKEKRCWWFDDEVGELGTFVEGGKKDQFIPHESDGLVRERFIEVIVESGAIACTVAHGLSVVLTIGCFLHSLIDVLTFFALPPRLNTHSTLIQSLLG
jgi:hypothetical protein